MNSHPLAGKTILVIGGRPKEMIDGVRYYANHQRPAHQGYQAATKLAQSGARVILLNNEPDASAAALLEAALKRLKHEKIDAVLQLASISSIKAASISPTKLKVKKSGSHTIPMEITGNIDVLAHVRAAWQGTVVGYNNYQHYVEYGDTALINDLRAIIEVTGQSEDKKETRHEIKSPATQKLRGKKIIVTSGPTVELVTAGGDVITNISSGAQGFAIAGSLADMGADIILISGPTALGLPNHSRITTMHAQSADDMLNATKEQLPADVYIGVAAVADFAAPSPLPLTLRENEPFTLRLMQNPDILSTIASHASRPAMVIGFAAENHDLLTYAAAKLTNKGADAICANPVDEISIKRIGTGNNQITWLAQAGASVVSEPWPVMSKRDIGQRIGDKIVEFLATKEN